MVEPLCSSSYSMLRSERLVAVSQGLQLAGFSCLFFYFYLHVNKCVREAEETPSHLSLLFWKPQSL